MINAANPCSTGGTNDDRMHAGYKPCPDGQRPAGAFYKPCPKSALSKSQLYKRTDSEDPRSQAMNLIPRLRTAIIQDPCQRPEHGKTADQPTERHQGARGTCW